MPAATLPATATAFVPVNAVAGPVPEGDDGLFEWLERQELHLHGRLDAIQRRATALRDYEALRARRCWDDDRRCDAEELGARLARRPSAVRARLAGSKHGARWLVRRWSALRAVLDAGADWTDAQASLAFDLLGIDHVLRVGDPWTMVGLDGPRALVDREIGALEASIAGTLEDLDAFERAAASAGNPVRMSAEAKALKRDEASCWRLLLAIQKVLGAEALRRAREAGFMPDDGPDGDGDEEDAGADDAPAALPPTPARPSGPSGRPAVGGNRRARRAAAARRRRHA